MAREKVKNIVIDGARIIFRNFTGKESKYNPQGRRKFGVIINNSEAAELEDEGWHIKWLKPRDEDEEPQAYLEVRVNYAEDSAPAIYMVTSRKKTLLTEENVATLDHADLKHVDLTITPYFWTKGDEHGITAYIKSGYFTIVEDPFYEKYAKYDEPNGIVASVDESIDADEIPFS